MLAGKQERLKMLASRGSELLDKVLKQEFKIGDLIMLKRIMKGILEGDFSIDLLERCGLSIDDQDKLLEAQGILERVTKSLRYWKHDRWAIK